MVLTMKKLISITLFSLYLCISPSRAAAFTITKNETRDVVGSYGAINGDSPYFPHTRIPHPNSGTSDGRIKTTDVDEYPGTGVGDFQQVKSVTLGMHDHDDKAVVAVYVHMKEGSWVPFVTERDLATIGGNTLCGEASTMYGLNRHPHNDSACYVNNTFTINANTDEILLKFSCAQLSDGCPRNDDVYVHISSITWDIEDPVTPTRPPTATPKATRTPTLTSTPTKTPTQIPTPTAVVASCWNTCATEGATSGSLTCLTYAGQRLWRNATCRSEIDCTCDPAPTATTTPAPVTNGPYCPL